MQNETQSEVTEFPDTIEPTEQQVLRGQIRVITRGAYDLKKLRIQNGNRLTASFRVKLGIPPGTKASEEVDKETQNLLDRLAASHRRITDAIVAATGTDTPTRRQIEKKFQGDELIGSTAELYLYRSYKVTLDAEESCFEDLERVLEDMPIYTEFLSKVSGIGPTMAGVLISEFDIHKAKYPSSMYAYAGIDVLSVIQYNDLEGKRHRWSFEQAREDDNIEFKDDGSIYYKGNLCEIVAIGRNNHACSMVKREYINAKGDPAVRNSLTYNPFLKSKLLGVIAGSFLKAGGLRVNGKAMGAAKRLERAKDMGMNVDDVEDDLLNDAVIGFLRNKGDSVELSSPYAKVYYDYKNRYANHPSHRTKQPIVHHRMALRVMVKHFLNDFYVAWRTLEGLPVMPPYHVAKLNMPHGEAVFDKGVAVE